MVFLALAYKEAATSTKGIKVKMLVQKVPSKIKYKLERDP